MARPGQVLSRPMGVLEILPGQARPPTWGRPERRRAGRLAGPLGELEADGRAEQARKSRRTAGLAGPELSAGVEYSIDVCELSSMSWWLLLIVWSPRRVPGERPTSSDEPRPLAKNQLAPPRSTVDGRRQSDRAAQLASLAAGGTTRNICHSRLLRRLTRRSIRLAPPASQDNKSNGPLCSKVTRNECCFYSNLAAPFERK